MSSRDRIFRALSNPTRRAIFEYLCRSGECPVSELQQHTGVSQPVVSRHLTRLRAAGLVDATPVGRETLCRARADALLVLIDWTDEMANHPEQRNADLIAVLKRARVEKG